MEALEALSGKQRRARLDAIRDACRAFITGPFLERLTRTAAATMAGTAALSDLALAADCARHARMFFGSPDLDLACAAPGTFALTPTDAMRAVLERDDEAMAGMIMGEGPPFSTVVRGVAELERLVNSPR